MKRIDAWDVIEDLVDGGFTPRIRRYKKYTDPKATPDHVALVLYMPYRSSEGKREALKAICQRHGVKYTYEPTRFVPGNEMVTLR